MPWEKVFLPREWIQIVTSDLIPKPEPCVNDSICTMKILDLQNSEYDSCYIHTLTLTYSNILNNHCTYVINQQMNADKCVRSHFIIHQHVSVSYVTTIRCLITKYNQYTYNSTNMHNKTTWCYTWFSLALLMVI